ncbi:sialate O-acetylesterase [Novosphingobium sp.]|uniref:sialate O-acetylesterase n=1 Tax=Novosphingobium sp. TaxID=1874826 RepID=UPI002631C182|nr:sialate O-acetylesterase [Novosphingobium sp.]
MDGIGGGRPAPTTGLASTTRLVLGAGLALALTPPAFAGDAGAVRAGQLVIGSVWTDHAVIQRGRAIAIPGRALPDRRIEARLGNETVRTRADASGRFTLRFVARGASADPLDLSITGEGLAPVLIRDLLVGDVVLCAGQSNMAMPLSQALDGWNRTRAAGDPALRLLTLPESTAEQPQESLAAPPRWLPDDPDSAGAFSAACHAMAVELRRGGGVPVGAIVAARGGTPIRPWLTATAALPLLDPADRALLALRAGDPVGAQQAHGRAWQDWYRQAAAGEEPWRDPAALDWQPVPALSPWNTWRGTSLARDPVGTVWLRRVVELSAAQAAGSATLELGRLDDVDLTLVNRVAVGGDYGADRDRTRRLPPGLLRAGANELLVAVTNLWGAGGFSGGTVQLRLGQGAPVALAEGWLWRRAPLATVPPRPPWDQLTGVGVIAQAMLAPLGELPLAGMVWYQGESDVGHADYARWLAAAIAEWRRQFGAGLPLAVVQIAGYGAPHRLPGESAGAELREAQRRAVLGAAGARLVTAVDLGERTDLHPANKPELGRRLALAISGTDLPQPATARREPGGVRLHFTGVSDGWESWGGPPLGFELCGVGRAGCRFAAARIEGSDIVLGEDGGAASRVRFAWADSPTINLYDHRQLPPPSFELAVQP